MWEALETWRNENIYLRGPRTYGSLRKLQTASKASSWNVDTFPLATIEHPDYRQFIPKFQLLNVIAYDKNKTCSKDMA